MGAVNHVVAFKFKPDVSQEDQQHLIKEMMALKDGCKDKDGKTYIQSLTGGPNSSPETHITHGTQVVFLVVLPSAEHRDYYVETDPVHGKFVKLAGQLVDEAVVADFEATF